MTHVFGFIDGDTLLRAYVYTLTAALFGWAVAVGAYAVAAGTRLGRRALQRLRPQGELTT